MSRLRRPLVLLLSFAALMAFSLQALAQDETPTDQPTTTVASDTSGPGPAVPVTTPNPAPAKADWTYRYMIPTAIVLALLIILFTTVQYFTSVVRKRYRVVDE
jgi:hypothetical protein